MPGVRVWLSVLHGGTRWQAIGHEAFELRQHLVCILVRHQTE